MEDFLIDLQQVREELKAEKIMYEDTIKNIYQTSPYLFNCGVQQEQSEAQKGQIDSNSVVKSKLVQGKQTASKAFDWILKKTGIKRKKTLLVPQNIAKVLKSVKPGQLAGLKEPWFHKACRKLFDNHQDFNLYILEYPPTFNQAIPVPKIFNAIQHQEYPKFRNALQQQSKGQIINKRIDPLDQQDWNDIHREVLNDLNNQKNRSNSLQILQSNEQNEIKKETNDQPQLQKQSSAKMSNSSSGKKLSQSSVRYTANKVLKPKGNQVKATKIQISNYTKLEKKKSGKGSRTLVLSQNYS